MEIQKDGEVLLRVREAAARCAIGVSTWWRLSADGIAPKPIRIGKRFTAWRASDVADFVERIAGGEFERGFPPQAGAARRKAS